MAGHRDYYTNFFCRPHFVLDTLEFAHTPLFHDPIVVHQKYVVEGLSIRQIAKNLSTMGVPTKCNGQKWHPEMIKRLLS